jgi:hypothetical protein
MVLDEEVMVEVSQELLESRFLFLWRFQHLDTTMPGLRWPQPRPGKSSPTSALSFISNGRREDFMGPKGPS